MVISVVVIVIAVNLVLLVLCVLVYATTVCGYIGGFCRHGRQLRERPSVLLPANASPIVEARVLQSMPIFGQQE